MVIPDVIDEFSLIHFHAARDRQGDSCHSAGPGKVKHGICHIFCSLGLTHWDKLRGTRIKIDRGIARGIILGD
jgi:hypothetical protein